MHRSQKIIYDDDEIQVIYLAGKSSYVLITFSDLYTRADGTRFFADIPAVKADLSCIGVVAKRGNWYPKRNLEAAASIILDHIRGYESRILYGGSMGAYAAIKYSALLGATQVIAFCPQWSIDARECQDIADPGWQEFFTESMREMGVTTHDIGGRVFIFSDKYHIVDNFHYQMLAKQSSSIEFINVPRVDHGVTTVLAGTTNLLNMISACQRDDIIQLRRITRNARIGSHFRVDKVRAFAKKRFGATYSLKIGADLTRNNAFLRRSPRNIVFVASQLADAGKIQQIAPLYDHYAKYINDPIEQLATCAQIGVLTSLDVFIKTVHDTFIFYDLHNNICIHGLDRREACFPVGLMSTGKGVQLLAKIGETTLRLGVKADQSIRMLGLKDEDCLFDLTAPGPGRFNISYNGRFVCSYRDSGEVKVDQVMAQAWEAYSFGLFDRSRVSQYTASELAERNARALALASLVRNQIDDTSAAPIWTYNQVLVYGQSLGSGYESWPTKTNSGRSDVLMVGRSVRPSGELEAPAPIGDANLHVAVATAQDADTGVPLDAAGQATLAEGDNHLGEEVGVAAMIFARKLFLQKHGLAAAADRLFVVSNAAVAGTTIEKLSKGASPECFNRLRVMASACKAAAIAAGGSYGIPALFWLQGEYNYVTTDGGSTDKESYKRHLNQLYADFIADVCIGIAAQSDLPAMITYQTSGGFINDATDLSISMAQLELSRENNSWYLAAPAYPYPDKLGIHLTANGTRWMAMKFAQVFHEVCVLRRKWKPLSPIRATWRGSTVVVDFHVPSPPLQWQPSYYEDNGRTWLNNGFTVIDALGTLLVNSVAIAGDAVIEIDCARRLVAPVNVYYGRNGTPGGPEANGGGGNLCDSDPLSAPFTYDYAAGSGDYPSANIAELVGKPYPLWNWCVVFKQLAIAN
ncbi:MAG: hypothetical protein P4M15_00070 [Alphaproteobacteria bacterium]|nr:hypothetical protein [Alphaproteobacteria bacterium]